MSIRDIIEAATAGDWLLDLAFGCVFSAPKPRSPGRIIADGGHHTDDAIYISTFDPEHVALMEAVVEAVQPIETTEDEALDSALYRWEKRIAAAKQALASYRSERGLL